MNTVSHRTKHGDLATIVVMQRIRVQYDIIDDISYITKPVRNEAGYVVHVGENFSGRPIPDQTSYRLLDSWENPSSLCLWMLRPALSLTSARFDPARGFSSSSSLTPPPLPLRAERYRFVPTLLPPPLPPRWILSGSAPLRLSTFGCVLGSRVRVLCLLDLSSASFCTGVCT
jgi:hypothetical protein